MIDWDLFATIFCILLAQGALLLFQVMMWEGGCRTCLRRETAYCINCRHNPSANSHYKSWGDKL